MNASFFSAPLVSDSCDVTRVRIVAHAAKRELEITVEHTTEKTRNEDGEEREISERTFRRSVACPVDAAQLMARRTYSAHPKAIVELVNA